MEQYLSQNMSYFDNKLLYSYQYKRTGFLMTKTLICRRMASTNKSLADKLQHNHRIINKISTLMTEDEIGENIWVNLKKKGS